MDTDKLKQQQRGTKNGSNLLANTRQRRDQCMQTNDLGSIDSDHDFDRDGLTEFISMRFRKRCCGIQDFKV